MCGGFSCSKNALIALNILYVLVGFLMIGVGVYGRAASIVTNLPIVGGILACGIILILISILGLLGAMRHHQVMLFFYMLILSMLFLIQFSIASACLAVGKMQQQEFAEEGWNRVSTDVRSQVQDTFLCCGFNTTAPVDPQLSCDRVTPICCGGWREPGCSCPPCMSKLEDTIAYVFQLCGGIGMFFSFTELLAVFLARRYRNQQDPFYELPARAVFPHGNYVY